MQEEAYEAWVNDEWKRKRKLPLRKFATLAANPRKKKTE